MTPSNGWLLVSEAAQELRRSESQVRRYVAAGLLRAEKRGVWQIRRDSVAALRDQERLTDHHHRDDPDQVRLREERLDLMRAMRRAGLSWARIGRELGTPSRAAAQRWFQRHASAEEYEALR